MEKWLSPSLTTPGYHYQRLSSGWNFYRTDGISSNCMMSSKSLISLEISSGMKIHDNYIYIYILKGKKIPFLKIYNLISS